MSRPLVSVVLPVYNGQATLQQALDSILSQDMGDFEIIAIDDGSKDDSYQILQANTDPRLKAIQQTNHGLAATLNIGIAQAQGQYIARQDQDDLALPGRFAKQIAYLQTHQDVALLGTAAQIWEQDQPTQRVHQHPTDPASLRFSQLFNNYFVHSSVMFRKSTFEQLGGYCEDKQRHPEDFELWSRFARQHAVANLPEVLQVYREMPGSMCRDGIDPYKDRVIALSAENLALATGHTQPTPAHTALATVCNGYRLAQNQLPGLDASKDALIACLKMAAQSMATQETNNLLQAALDQRVDMVKRLYDDAPMALRTHWHKAKSRLRQAFR